jgi:hypothetical protein
VAAGRFGRILLPKKQIITSQNLKGSKNVQYVRMPRNNEEKHQENKDEGQEQRKEEITF